MDTLQTKIQTYHFKWRYITGVLPHAWFSQWCLYHSDVTWTPRSLRSRGTPLFFQKLGWGNNERNRKASYYCSFSREFHRWPVVSPHKTHKSAVMRKALPCHLDKIQWWSIPNRDYLIPPPPHPPTPPPTHPPPPPPRSVRVLENIKS